MIAFRVGVSSRNTEARAIQLFRASEMSAESGIPDTGHRGDYTLMEQHLETRRNMLSISSGTRNLS